MTCLGWSTFTPPVALVKMPKLSSAASMASCRSTATPATPRSVGTVPKVLKRVLEGTFLLGKVPLFRSVLGIVTAETIVCDAETEVFQLAPVERSAVLAGQDIFNERATVVDRRSPAGRPINAVRTLMHE